MAEPRDWTELVVKAAELMGFNPVRVRWRLHRLRQDAQKAKVAAADKVTELSYEHKACPHCGAVADREEKKCPRCGAALRSKLADRLYRLGLALPVALSFSTLLAVALCLVYARLAIAEPDPARVVGGFSSAVYLRFGALFPPAVASEPWRLGTAMFLHIGLWHLGFNAFALLQVGPTIEDLYGRWALPAFFLVTGIVANVASLQFGLAGLQAGASGGLMGLTGVAAGWGHRAGTSLGREVRNRMLQWVAYTVLFGFIVRADNVAHVGGFVAGAALGFAVGPDAMKRFARSAAAVPAALVVGLSTAALVALTLVPPQGSRWAASALDGDGAAGAPRADVQAELGAPCELLAQGKADEARSALERSALFDRLSFDKLPGLCLALRQRREHCERVLRGDWSVLRLEGLDAQEQERLKRSWRENCEGR